MRRIKPVLLPLVVAGLSIGIAACGSDDNGRGGGGGGATSLDLTIGDSIPLTGDLVGLRPARPEGGRDLAVYQINKAIKEAGADHTVKLNDTRTTQTDRPQAGVQAARKLVDLTTRAASPVPGRRRTRSRPPAR